MSWNNVFKDLLHKSNKVGNTYELINYSFELSYDNFICPYDNIFDIIKGNKMIDWYKRADEFDCSIEDIFPSYLNVKNKTIPYYNSNYGLYVYKELQFESCYNKLLSNKETRQAQIILNRHDILHDDSTLDKICTQSITFLIRNNKLQMVVNMRSNDVVNLMPYDIYFFTRLLVNMYYKLKDNYKDLELGNYIHNVTSLHFYEDDLDKVNEILKILN